MSLIIEFIASLTSIAVAVISIFSVYKETIKDTGQLSWEVSNDKQLWT